MVCVCGGGRGEEGERGVVVVVRTVCITRVSVFLPFPLFTSSLRCVCVTHSLFRGLSLWKNTHWV